MVSPASKTNLFEYDDYRAFLRDDFAARKAADKKFSYRYFARTAGIQAHSFIIHVLQGKVDLSEDSIAKFAKALKLDREQTKFFRSLVLFNQAKSSEEKANHARELLASRAYRKIKPLNESHFRFYATWYYTPIREMVCLPDFNEDPEWIAGRIIPNISAKDAKKALDELLLLGLLTRDENGRLVQTDALISTADEVASSAIAEYHKEMMKLASESIDRIPREQRALLAQTVGVSEEGAEKIKEIIKRARREVFEVVAEEQKPTSVYQLNFQLFPLALPKTGSEK